VLTGPEEALRKQTASDFLSQLLLLADKQQQARLLGSESSVVSAIIGLLLRFSEGESREPDRPDRLGRLGRISRSLSTKKDGEDKFEALAELEIILGQVVARCLLTLDTFRLSKDDRKVIATLL